jgi:TPP-dependent trihydroxycyclohexane-1,2-dione (THcHDO) dehydratase
VYHVRRLVALIVLVGAGVGINGVLSAATGGQNAQPEATATNGATTVAACDPAAVVISGNVDHDTYAEGELPKLSMTITNTSDVACTIEVGTDKQKYIITSGSDTIWDSTVCQSSTEPFVQEFAAGEAITTNTFEWGRARSDNCDNGTPAVGGGASYQLSVQLGEIASAESKQFMLY